MEMKTRIKVHFPHQNIVDYKSNIYIADYTTEQTQNKSVKRGVKISTIKPSDIKSFFIQNEKSILFSTIIFDDKSFIDETTGNTLSQCECVCFSSAEYDKGPWVLFLELKYCDIYSKYQKENIEKAKFQLVDTYKYYKQKGIINHKQQCYLVVSFPYFRIPFPNFVITQTDVKNMKLDRVIFRGVNELKIKNEFKLEV